MGAHKNNETAAIYKIYMNIIYSMRVLSLEEKNKNAFSLNFFFV